MREFVSFETLRRRAYELADTGVFSRWEEIGAAMEVDDYPLATLRLSSDPLLKQMVNTRCRQAKERL